MANIEIYDNKCNELLSKEKEINIININDLREYLKLLCENIFKLLELAKLLKKWSIKFLFKEKDF